MEIITENAEKELGNYVTSITQKVGDWLCVHIAFSQFEAAFQAKYKRPQEAFKQHRENTVNLVNSALYQPLKNQEGKIFICTDNDSFAVFKLTDDEILKRLRFLSKEFIGRDLKDVFSVYSLGKKSVDLDKLITKKEKKAALQKMKYAETEHSQPEINFDDFERRLLTRKHRAKDYILVIEDDELYSAMIKMGFESYYEIIVATTAKDGALKYVQYAPDMVFLDIHLPDGDGIDLLKQLTELDKEAYIVMLSADSVTDNVVSTNKLGAAGFITKPPTRQKVREYILKCPTLTKKNIA